MDNLSIAKLGNFNSFRLEPIEKGGHKVFIDDIEIKHVTHLSFDMGVDCLTSVTVEFHATEMDVLYNKDAHPYYKFHKEENDEVCTD